jgi:SAM-dependent methyltransferase
MLDQTRSDEIYHHNNRHIPLADRLGYVARMRMYKMFVEVMQPTPESQVLDIGVTDNTLEFRSINLLEQVYPHRDHLTCVGIVDGEAFQRKYPGVRYVRVSPEDPLPFADRQFDIVYSNAVLEHVGTKDRQREFVQEACRVGKRVFLAVPNRLFPVEVHTGIPFLHWLPKPWFRALLSRTPFRSHSLEENLNHIWPGELREMYPEGRTACTLYAGIGCGPFSSNVVSYCR